MDSDTTAGIAIIALALLLVTVMVWWSTRTINWIARTGPRSARKIMKDQGSGR